MTVLTASSESKLEGFAQGAAREDPEIARDDAYWVDLARRSFEASETFYSGYAAKRWAKAQDHFANRHAEGSRYRNPEYVGQTRVFRPKSRSMVRRGEAQCARAFFSTADVVNVAPEDDSDPRQLASAEVTSAILNYRLTKQVPWFKILMGQYQTGQVNGVMCSYQGWRYEETEKPGEPRIEPVLGELGLPKFDADGVPEFRKIETTVTEVVRDELEIEPIAPEDLKLHPGASWLDPVNSSPYLIWVRAMTVAEVRAMAERADPKTGRPAWRDVPSEQLASARFDTAAGQRQKREGGIDPQAQETAGAVHDHELVKVHFNFVKADGKDWCYYTLGADMLLSDPVDVAEAYPHLKGKRPFSYGVGLIEAFRLVPDSKINLVFDLQVKANHIENMRLENVLQVLHPKTLVRIGSQIDIQAMGRARSGIVMNSQKPAEDVAFLRPPDVTASAYQEQNMVNLDLDEIGGAFSPGSIASNRQLNETVGGLNLLNGDANALSEFELRVFAETWVEDALRQCVKLIQYYESDPVVVSLAGKRAGIWQRYGLDPMTDDLLSAELTTTVNVGMGSTNPEARLARFIGALKATFEAGGQLMQAFGPGVLNSPGFEAISKEIFGHAGYKDGKRFLDFRTEGGNPEMQKLQQAMEQLQSQLQSVQAQLEDKSEEIASDERIAVMEDQGETKRTAMKIAADARVEANRHMASMLRPVRAAA
jgi:hypothetical protein